MKTDSEVKREEHWKYFFKMHPNLKKKTSEYDQVIPQSHTEDQPTGPRGRAP